MTHKDKELVFALRKCWAKHSELQLAATRIEKLNAKVEEWRTRHDNLLRSALEQTRKDAMRIAELEDTLQRERAMGVLLAIDGELYGDTQKLFDTLSHPVYEGCSKGEMRCTFTSFATIRRNVALALTPRWLQTKSSHMTAFASASPPRPTLASSRAAVFG